MNATTIRLSDPVSPNASAILAAVTLDGASLGRMTRGCRSAISPSEGNVSGSASAIATQTPITAQGQRTTTPASLRMSPACRSHLAAPRQATRPQ